MATIEEVRNRLEVANSRVKTLNDERSKNQGQRETLEKQLQTALENYNKAYGVNLTVDSIDAEIQSVLAKKEQEVQNIEAILSAISSGNYDEARRLAGETVDETTQNSQQSETVASLPSSGEVNTDNSAVAQQTVAQAAPQSVQESIPTPQPTSQPEPQPQPQSVSAPVGVSAPTGVGSPMPPTSPSPAAPSAPTAPSAPMPPSGNASGGTIPMGVPQSPQSGTENILNGALQNFTSVSGAPLAGLGGIGSPQQSLVQTSTPTDFKDILNGSDFAAQ